MTLLIIALNALIHLVGEEYFDSLASISGSSTEGVLHGEWWRLLTSGWVHLDTAHLMGNLRYLVMFGLLLEPAIGTPWFALIYLLSTLGGSVAAGFFDGSTGVGASGGTFGLNGALLVVSACSGRWRSRLVWLWVAYLAVSGIENGREYHSTGHAAHLGGLLTGILVAACVGWGNAIPKLVWSRRRLLGTVAVGLLIADPEITDPRWPVTCHASVARIQTIFGRTADASSQWRLVEASADSSRPVEAVLLHEAALFRWYEEDDALAAIKLMARVAPTLEDPDVYSDLGYLQMKADPPDYCAAHISLLESLKLRPDSPEALNRLEYLHLSIQESCVSIEP